MHYRIACLRADLLHKLTTEVAKTSGLVAVEDLHVKGLIQNRCLSRSFSDAALGKLLANWRSVIENVAESPQERADRKAGQMRLFE